MSEKPINILLLEDEEAHVKLIQRAFESHAGRFSLTVASTVQEARAYLAGSVAELLITDLVLPDGKGTDFLPVDQQQCRFPIVLMTCRGSEQMLVEAIKAGALDYVIKSRATMSDMPRIAERALRQWKQITERKQAEERLRESEERFRSIFEHSTIGIYRTTPDGRIVMANPALVSMLGYVSFEQVARRNLEENGYEPGYPRSAFKQRMEAEGRVTGMESAWTRADGSTLFVRESGFAVRDRAGNVLYYEGTVEDITGRKQAEDALHRRDTVLEAVAFAADRFLKAGDWERDIQAALARMGKATDVSRVYIFENHVGEDGQLLTSQRYEWAATTPLIDASELQNFDYHANGFTRWEDTLSRGDVLYGHIRDFPPDEQRVLAPQHIQSVAVVPIFVDGNWYGFIGFDECRAPRDWSLLELDALRTAAAVIGAALYRRQAAQKLQVLSSAVEQSTKGIAIVDMQGNLQFCNEAFADMHGYAADELGGKHLSIFHTPEQMPSVEASNRQIREQGDFNGEIWHVRRDGTLFPTLMRNSLLRDEAGNAIGMIGTARNITDMKRAEEALQRVRDRLEERVEQRTTTLKATIRELRREIADRIAAEEAARQSEERFFKAFHASPTGIAITTIAEGRFVDVNDSLLRMMGYTRDEVIGRPKADWGVWNTPEDRARVVQKL